MGTCYRAESAELALTTTWRKARGGMVHGERMSQSVVAAFDTSNCDKNKKVYLFSSLSPFHKEPHLSLIHI